MERRRKTLTASEARDKLFRLIGSATLLTSEEDLLETLERARAKQAELTTNVLAGPERGASRVPPGQG